MPPATGSQSSAAQLGLNIKRDVFNPLLAQCVKVGPTYTVPTTAHDPRLLQIPLPLLDEIRDQVAGAVPTFYHDEPDSNQDDKPRLDILFTMQDGSWLRYHPGATPIWSDQALPTVAMTTRYNRAHKLAKHVSSVEYHAHR